MVPRFRLPRRRGGIAEVAVLLRELLAAQDRQNELLEELLNQFNSTQRQRPTSSDSGNRPIHSSPAIAGRRRGPRKSPDRVPGQPDQEITENYESLRDGEFMLNEFVDRFGPRLAHLNGLLQVLSQLSSSPNPAGAPNTP